ncbi:hypothetical protein ACFOZ7_14675 [Natribaculum luteum]|uniref:Uncharacterized protein n=1 Tax=Natribaculum luteum TaxID=1586232 RepID=A0ABD5P1L0_9EURY|nr:hypothetical protein [Natribaculum luteum]
MHFRTGLNGTRRPYSRLPLRPCDLLEFAGRNDRPRYVTELFVRRAHVLEHVRTLEDVAGDPLRDDCPTAP